IAVDSHGAAYVAGYTTSTDFPPASVMFQRAQKDDGAANDAFVTKFLPDGSALVYSTYLGGNGSDTAFAIAVDGTGAAYVAGATIANNFPVSLNPYQPTLNGGQN